MPTGTSPARTAPGRVPVPPPAPGSRSAAAVLAIACAAQFMVILDVSIVNVALPSMRAELHLSGAGQQWIVNAYTLGFAGLLLLGGRMADLIGTRRAFLGGLTVFTLASLAGGFATNGAWLIGARAAQGVGGAVLAPATLTLIMTTFTEPAARTRAMGAWSAVMAAGGAAGAVVGGVLTQYAGWRWVLFVNVPLGAVLLAAALVCVRAGAVREGGLRRLDLPGAVTVTAGLTSLVYGIIASETHGWGSLAVWGPVAAAVVLLAAFVAVEARAAHPLVPLAIFRRRTLATANMVVVAISAAMFSMWFLLSLYLQQALGYSAVRAGLCFLPGSLAIIVASRIATRLLGRTGARPLLLTGLALSTAGFAWLSLVGGHGSYATDVVAPFVLAAFGTGLATMPTTVTATSGTAPGEAGLASGLVNTSRQVGGALGLALLGTIASHTTAARLAAHPGDVRDALAAGYGRGLLVAAVCTAVAALIGLALPRRRPAS
ncbi:MFS transporter [Streptomyces cinnamoneus]|uniref:MFS transporter n=1 Tax=Streptomyces cinnamoneus TaxID=53446 RepID=A0A2G1XC58_STRCJ|nr:MFS transporter [Streptomyces cinnamoneus]PHQ48798.1 MFS transporter [Streptomyces cinnamoneus]PPT14552.1 MFS transporter [Streptomyces cinnamoneus]